VQRFDDGPEARESFGFPIGSFLFSGLAEACGIRLATDIVGVAIPEYEDMEYPFFACETDSGHFKMENQI